ncbi:MAG: TPM domain-containing protein [Burkholderiales bacterium]|jgi:hypothetical protein
MGSATRAPGTWGRLRRALRHLLTDHADLRRAIDPAVLAAVATQVGAGEQGHLAELRVALEPSLAPLTVLRGLSPRERALEVFGRLGVWDTEGNNGVLLYLLLADHAVEIVADRAAARAIPQAHWDAVARALAQAFAAGQGAAGLQTAVARITELLSAAFPATEAARNPDELPDRPAVL